ncbi:hypothetical protein LOTGIDRAFT_166850 [Lottia gigantea]|uniref:Uncharacterized protein n=1 Tax=Lottia gigantea TaxID=225164 RepID=V4A0R3_LOTGI|nr:hypothetical protein LOTGIDRAFT_166850 [Lottia gigantea]ESO86846.1 hypothetical protein LOTGIDRAFT_166850 [Lottia gigantea]
MMRYTLLLIITWYSLVDCKPLHDNQAVESIIRNSLSQTMTEKADAIDNLLRLLSEIDLPSICNALSAQQHGGKDKMATVDAILAEAAKSQAMTFIPTNFPETSKVTRPGTALLFSFQASGLL